MRGVLDIPEDLIELQGRIADSLVEVERVFGEQLASDLLPVDAMCAHVERYRGKMLRPTLVMLCGAVADPDGEFGSRAHVIAGAVCEMVHMATLVHDDVLDEAEIRRRGKTLNELRGNEAAVILGDYLIASAYALCSSLESPVPSRIVGNASAVMCTGELLQLHNRENLSLDEGTYFEILERKTAALIGASCELGALCSLGFGRGDDPVVGALRAYGRSMGVAFQIQDDVLDLTGTEEVVGKSVGKDLEKGKLTYPVIHHLGALGGERRGQSLGWIRSIAGGDASATGRLLEAIRSTGSIEAARVRAGSLVDEAKRSLDMVGENAGSSMLRVLADAVVRRDH
ncbi:MAG: polyprenyl synthetase family protein [Phycisphaerales bacterium]|nr:polyprenyl synthetase family protein [Phycisphaerales bacterium]